MGVGIGEVSRERGSPQAVTAIVFWMEEDIMRWEIEIDQSVLHVLFEL